MSFKPPGPLIINEQVSSEWKLFKNQFQLFLKASEGEGKPDGVKVAQLLNIIGTEALTIFYTFRLGEISTLTLDSVIKAFDEYFIPTKNIVYQRYMFFKRTQQEGKSFNTYLTDLKKLAAYCEFYKQEDSLIRDRIVVGISDEILQERLV